MIGYGASADAHHITQPAPEGEGAARAMNAALDQASLAPDEIEYINAHGTSTPLNDRFETMAIKSVFEEYAYDVPISSTKSMTGHLLGASGSLEAALSVMAISESAIPPTVNLEFPDPDCDLDYTPSSRAHGRCADRDVKLVRVRRTQQLADLPGRRVGPPRRPHSPLPSWTRAQRRLPRSA